MNQMAPPHHGTGPRHSILDLAPLELECLSVLWPLGEGTVREIHRQLAASRHECSPSWIGRARNLCRDIFDIVSKDIGRILNAYIDAKLFG